MIFVGVVQVAQLGVKLAFKSRRMSEGRGRALWLVRQQSRPKAMASCEAAECVGLGRELITDLRVVYLANGPCKRVINTATHL